MLSAALEQIRKIPDSQALETCWNMDPGRAIGKKTLGIGKVFSIKKWQDFDGLDDWEVFFLEQILWCIDGV